MKSLKRAKLSMEGERWVNCPVCGNKIMKARRADVDEICEECGNLITICVTKDCSLCGYVYFIPYSGICVTADTVFLLRGLHHGKITLLDQEMYA